MGNPTREEAELHFKENHTCLMCDRISKAYLRALDMRDKIAQILESEVGPWYKPKEMRRAIQRFEGGGA